VIDLLLDGPPPRLRRIGATTFALNGSPGG